MGYIIFNGKSSEDFGLEVETFPTYDMPERNYESVTIPGRNGEFLIDQKTFKNVNRSYKVSIATSERGKLGPIDTNYSYAQVVNRIAEWLNTPYDRDEYFDRSSSAISDETAIYMASLIPGYRRLEDSYEPEYYRMAYLKGAISVENLVDEAGRVTLTFNCLPQRYLKDGEKPIVLESSAQFLTNKTSFDAKPLMIIEKVASEYTDIDFDIYYDSDNPHYAAEKHRRIATKYKITIDPINVPTITPGEIPSVRLMLDCETQNTIGLENPSYYLDATDGNLNKYMRFRGLTGQCPVLEPGITQLHFTINTKILGLKIIPRWWTI